MIKLVQMGSSGSVANGIVFNGFEGLSIWLRRNHVITYGIMQQIDRSSMVHIYNPLYFSVLTSFAARR